MEANKAGISHEAEQLRLIIRHLNDTKSFNDHISLRHGKVYDDVDGGKPTLLKKIKDGSGWGEEELLAYYCPAAESKFPKVGEPVWVKFPGEGKEMQKAVVTETHIDLGLALVKKDLPGNKDTDQILVSHNEFELKPPERQKKKTAPMYNDLEALVRREVADKMAYELPRAMRQIKTQLVRDIKTQLKREMKAELKTDIVAELQNDLNGAVLSGVTNMMDARIAAAKEELSTDFMRAREQ